jgi:hypothetical protein
MVIAAILSLGIGLSLGLLGGGGSTLALPVLVYVAGIPPTDAVAPSLAIVGATSLFASIAHGVRGQVNVRVAALFGGAGLLGALVGARLTHLVPGRILMFAFAALLLAVGIKMTRGAADPGPRPVRSPALALVAGTAVGTLTGFLGVGGGFVIVPALTSVAGLPIRAAIGTSLVVITLNSAAGFVGHLDQHDLHLGLTLLLASLACVGALLGTALAGRLAAHRLRRAFAGLLVAVGIAVTVRTLVLG